MHTNLAAHNDDALSNDDNDIIAKLAVPELKILCHAHNLTVGRRKQDIISRLVHFSEGTAALMSDGEDANERDDAVADT